MEDTNELNNDQKLAIFLDTIGSNLDSQTANSYLEMSNWDVENAVNLYFTNQIEGGEEPTTSTEAPEVDEKAPKQGRGGWEQAPSNKSPKKNQSSSRGGIRSFGDVVGKADSENEEKEGQDMFAGGEKSGTAIRMPGMPDNVNQLLEGLLNRANQPREEESEDEGEPGPSTAPTRSVFIGSGNRLADDSQPETATAEVGSSIQAPGAFPGSSQLQEQSLKLEKVVKKLNLWKDGLSIEDGPLIPYNSPEGELLLNAINTGMVPLNMLNVQRGQAVDLHVNKRMDENYRPSTPPPAQPFSGTGNRLGNPVPSLARAQAPSTSQSAPPAEVILDPNQPTTSIQVRLTDGTRLVGKFNHTHTIGDLRAFINGSRPNSGNYALQTAFPIRQLEDDNQTLSDAKLLNSAVIQRNI